MEIAVASMPISMLLPGPQRNILGPDERDFPARGRMPYSQTPCPTMASCTDLCTSSLGSGQVT
jgi:hypothetical protein